MPYLLCWVVNKEKEEDGEHQTGVMTGITYLQAALTKLANMWLLTWAAIAQEIVLSNVYAKHRLFIPVCWHLLLWIGDPDQWWFALTTSGSQDTFFSKNCHNPWANVL